MNFIKDTIKEIKDRKAGVVGNKEYSEKLKREIAKARQEAYRKQAIISAKASASAKAKRQYNPPQQAKGRIGNTSPIFNQLMYGEAPKQQKEAIRREIKKIRKKPKKSKNYIKRVIVRNKPKANQFDIFKL